ncbi:hypothetical protein BOX15_Mlig021743g1 [Macrostomum lignano]|uniref:Plectin/eS10 N-terminal domain-containing protein n=1 Tax=Macrostomum lignano TaxID=282301 RepID=A0A267FV79_9PLAT|nr:hypothetical protein BOX15_Mlig021743g1 [Macrostomum lignano]
MLIPKKDRVAIYERLFSDGVMVAKKDVRPNVTHPQVSSVRNLHVIKALTSLKSRGFVREQFAWRHYYWFLTNEGIEHLRKELHLPTECVPTTLSRRGGPGGPRDAGAPGEEDQRGGGGRSGGGGGQAERFAYRKTAPAAAPAQ